MGGVPSSQIRSGAIAAAPRNAIGIAPETTSAYIVQRLRWARGKLGVA